jgi:hypothetical protein
MGASKRLLLVLPEREDVHSLIALSLYFLENSLKHVASAGLEVGAADGQACSNGASAHPWDNATVGAMGIFLTQWEDICARQDVHGDVELFAYAVGELGDVIKHCPQLRELGEVCERVKADILTLNDAAHRMKNGEHSGQLVKRGEAAEQGTAAA